MAGTTLVSQRSTTTFTFPGHRVSKLSAAGTGKTRADWAGRRNGAALQPPGQLGANPTICVDKLRPHTQRIWQHFSIDEKREFCNRFAARWNVMRHRVAEPVHARLMEAVSSGKLRVHKGRIVALNDAGPNVRVTIESDHEEPTFSKAARSSTALDRRPAFPPRRNRSSKAFWSAAWYEQTGRHGHRSRCRFAALERDDGRSSFLFALGPLLKGTLWETTAVPEIGARQCESRQYFFRTSIPSAAAAEIVPTFADVIEYYI